VCNVVTYLSRESFTILLDSDVNEATNSEENDDTHAINDTEPKDNVRILVVELESLQAENDDHGKKAHDHFL